MGIKTEYELESLFIERLQQMGYEYVEMKSYNDLLINFKKQFERLNKDKITEAKGSGVLSSTEFDRVMLRLNGKTVYESAQILREQFILTLDCGKQVYTDFFDNNRDRTIYQVIRQIMMNKGDIDDIEYKNRYDVTILINGLPLIQVELKRSGVEINEAINQINRYRKDSFRGLFHYIQLFVVSNSDQAKYFANCNENQSDGKTYNPILKSLAFYWTDGTNKRINKLDDFATDFFDKFNIIEMIGKYMVIKESEPVLMVMRPYQIYAVKAALDRILTSNLNGYTFACTGSGKTLTSFKLATLLRENSRIEKVFFLVDRKDLDDQTIDEYNSFEPDCVDATTSTYTLVKQLKDKTKKLVVTTIQKLANAINNPRYEKDLDPYKNNKCIFIIDECHRTQFGKMHGDIKRHFKNANYIGFTGTPIFEKNKGIDGRTTADIFHAGTDVISGKPLDPCLHRYMIKEAIADGNVLRFSVEYQRSIHVSNSTSMQKLDYEKLDDPDYCRQHNIDVDALYHDPVRIGKVGQHILDNLEKHTHPLGKDVYTSIFAVDKIATLMEYYRYIKTHNSEDYKIAAIFTYQANEDMDEGADQYSRDNLEECINDYNVTFGTSFSVDTFDAYRKDISKRLKQKDIPQVDLLLVVNMFLTGFDAKQLNTLFLDKNMVWHTLVQAYSRTNRVFKPTKQFGQIITYRNIKKKAQDEALKLFSGDGNPNEYLLEDYNFYVNEYFNKVDVLRLIAPTPEDAGHIISEDEKKFFVIGFRQITSILATLKTFSKFDWADLNIALSEEEYMSYKSWYLTFYDEMKKAREKGKKTELADVDFEIELMRTDKINVVYILNLLKDINRNDENAKRLAIDLILRELERSDNEALRYRYDIMKEFITTRFFDLDPEDDIQTAYEEFENDIKNNEIEAFAIENNIKLEIIQDLLNIYLFRDEVSKEEIRFKVKDLRLGLIKTTELTDTIHIFIKGMHNKYSTEGV